MRVKIIAYNAQGYQLTIAALNMEQVLMQYGSISEPEITSVNTKFCSGIGLRPSDFPEAVKFDIVIEE